MGLHVFFVGSQTSHSELQYSLCRSESLNFDHASSTLRWIFHTKLWASCHKYLYIHICAYICSDVKTVIDLPSRLKQSWSFLEIALLLFIAIILLNCATVVLCLFTFYFNVTKFASIVNYYYHGFYNTRFYSFYTMLFCIYNCNTSLNIKPTIHKQAFDLLNVWNCTHSPSQPLFLIIFVGHAHDMPKFDGHNHLLYDSWLKKYTYCCKT